MARPISSQAATRWTIRIIPLFILGAFGFAKYVVIAHLCVNYIYRERREHGLAAALITLYFVFFTLTIVTYLRTFYTAHFRPGLVPLSDKRKDALRAREHQEGKGRGKGTAKDNDMNNSCIVQRKGGDDEEQAQPDWMPVDMDPDSPGLETFYSKQMFICEPDGRPRWCSLCWDWKPDRASHSTELGRCVRKMDHLCPWVGGMVSERSFNWFVQFTSYCTLYTGVCLATAGYSLRKQLQDGLPVDGRIAAILGLAGLFCLFAIGMTMTSGKYVLENITNIDMLRAGATHHVAVRIPTTSPFSPQFTTVTYPLPLPATREDELRRRAENHGFTIIPRDMHATHSFAVLRTEPGENPFDLGPWRNFKAVMGNSVLEWLLPIRHSPCCDHDSMVSDYEFGPLIGELKKRYNVPGAPDYHLTDLFGTQAPSTASTDVL